MRLQDGRYRCVVCGAAVDIPTGKQPKYVVKAASGRPNVRVLMVEGLEVHRCKVTVDEP